MSKVELKIGEQRVEIELDWAVGNRGKCPECGAECAVHDRREAREWRYLDTMQFEMRGCALKCYVSMRRLVVWVAVKNESF